MSIGEALIFMLLIPIVWFLIIGIIMIHIRVDAKKKWHKNEKTYPYFHYPFYKKIFLLGLKGAINKFVVIACFIGHISTILIFIMCIWLLVAPNIYIDYLLRALSGVWLVSLFTIMGAYGFSASRF